MCSKEKFMPEKKPKRIPDFKSEDEERRLWATAPRRSLENRPMVISAKPANES
jgi:hypothetical protein